MVWIIQSMKFLLRNLGFQFKLNLVKQIPENTDRVVSGSILTSVLLRNLKFKIELYLMKQIPENTDRVVSGLILTSVLLRIELEKHSNFVVYTVHTGISFKKLCTLHQIST